MFLMHALPLPKFSGMEMNEMKTRPFAMFGKWRTLLYVE